MFDILIPSFVKYFFISFLGLAARRCQWNVNIIGLIVKSSIFLIGQSYFFLFNQFPLQVIARFAIFDDAF